MTDYIEYDSDPRNLPQDVLAAIGLVTAASAQTESIVELGIGGCLGVDAEYSMAVTTHMSAPLRDHVLRAAAEIRIDNPDDLDELDGLLDAINDAFGRRNRYVHHCWCIHAATKAVFTNKIVARGSLDVELVPVTVDQIKGDAALIYDAGMALMAFLMKRKLCASYPPANRPRAHKTKAARKKRRKALLKKD